MTDKGYKSEELELTVEQSDTAWDYISYQSDITEKSAGEQLKKINRGTNENRSDERYNRKIF